MGEKQFDLIGFGTTKYNLKSPQFVKQKWSAKSIGI